MKSKKSHRRRVLQMMAATLLLLLSTRPLCAEATRPVILQAGPAVALVENLGRLDERVRFSARQGGIHLFCADDSLVVQVVKFNGDPRTRRLRPEERHLRGTTGRSHSIVMRFSGARPHVTVEGLDPVSGVHHFRGGSAGLESLRNRPGFRTVRYAGLWPGVDLQVHADSRRFEYDLLLEPGADLDGIVFECRGTDSVAIDPSGNLRLGTSLGPVFHSAPATYQIDATGNRIPVRSSFRLLDGHSFGFAVPDRDPSQSLLIDPGLSFSSYLGGSGNDEAESVALDANGAIYVTGTTASSDFPTVPGPSTFQGVTDIFVSKFDSTASSLIFSVVFGGSEADRAWDIALDTAGAAYVVGYTASSDFPVTAGAFDTTFAGGGSMLEMDGFVTKLSPVDGSLVYSTYLGGAADIEFCRAVTVDGIGRAHVAGWTQSADFPTTPGAFQTTLASSENDGFIAIFDPSGSVLVAATFLGGLGSEMPSAIALQESGDIVVGGLTDSGDYPVVAGGFDMTINGPGDCFVTTLDADLSSLRNSTFLGGRDLDWLTDLDLGPAGSIHVVGHTESIDFPVTAGAPGPSLAGGDGDTDAFVALFDRSGSTLLYSTFLGGRFRDVAWRVRVDALGRASVIGWTASPDFPVVAHAVFPTPPGTFNCFVSQFGVSGTTYNYGTFFGGPDYTIGTGIDLRPSGPVIVGETSSFSFPTTPGAFDTTHNGAGEAFVAAIDDQIQGLGFELPGVTGAPRMAVDGPLAPGSTFEYVVRNANPSSLGALFLGTSAAFSPFHGGTLVPDPLVTFWITTSPQGAYFLQGTWPAALPSGTLLYLQTWILDPTGPAGASATEGLSLTVP